MKWLKRITTVAVYVIFAVYLCLFCPIPPKRLASTQTSPDGKEVARFYWRPCGLLGAVSKDNPYVYVEITDTASDMLVLSQSTWGDIPNDGPHRFAGIRAWIVDDQK